MRTVPIQASLLAPSSKRLAELALWRSDPLKAFEAFVASREYVTLGDRPPAIDGKGEPRALSRRSRAVYVAMFSAFGRWLASNKRPIFEVSTGDLLNFLDGHTAAKTDAKKVSRIRADYLRMLKRVFDHLEVSGNPARALAFDARETPGATGRNQPTIIIPEDQVAAFVAALPYEQGAKRWKRRRDRAMQALMLGSGLTVDEVIRLRPSEIGEVDKQGRLPITIERDPPRSKRRGRPGDKGASVTRREHTTYVWPELAPVVTAWRDERRALGIGGEFLFPAGPIGGENADQPVNPATVYRQAKKTYQRAGITVARPGCRTLRNTFAVRELAKGTPKDELREYLGHHEKRAVDLYDHAKTAFRPGGKVQSR